MSYVYVKIFYVNLRKMGNTNTFNLNVKKGRDELSRIECTDFDTIKKTWQIVETDNAYYGFAFCTVLFKNHPQYAKYFEDESIPEFVREAKVKKKFTGILDIISALFVDYRDKPIQRDYLLGYIAMIHKDMGLTLEDFENFMSSLLETLIIELPLVMNTKCILIHMKYFKTLTEVFVQLTELHRVNMEQLLHSNRTIKRCCPWRNKLGSQMIYGHTLKYWLYKKRYWDYRKALWASLEVDALKTSKQNSINEKHKEKLHSRRKSMEIRRIDRRRQSRAIFDKSVSSDSDQAEGEKKNESRISQTMKSTWLRPSPYKKKTALVPRRFSKFFPLETINEVKYDGTQRKQITVYSSDTTLKTPHSQKRASLNTRSSSVNTPRERKRKRDSRIATNEDDSWYEL